ncbi:MAG: tellurium resistance protein TerC, partial [Bacteroidota bacterium]
YFDENDESQQQKASVNKVIMMIVLMNLIFSFDSILSAMALSDVFWVMASAIIISGILMIWLSDGVSKFLAKNRLYEILGLFILFLVGVMLLSEGGHLAHLEIFGNPITPMSKTTFYFVIFILVVVDLVQGKYQKKLLSSR